MTPTTTSRLQHPDAPAQWSEWSEDQTVHIVVPYSNPFRWRTRRQLVNNCIRHLRSLANLRVYVVELAFGDRPFEVTGGHPDDVQLTSSHEFFAKEMLTNLGVQRFPRDERGRPLWKYGGYIDGDFTFTRHDLGLEIIHQLQHYDFVQPFSQYADLTGGIYGEAHRQIRTNNSFAFNYVKNGYQLPTGWANGGWRDANICNGDDYARSMALGTPVRYVGATGGAWCWRRESFDAVGGMLDVCALGHGDWFMTFGLVGEEAPDMRIDGYHPEYRNAILSWQRKAAKLKKNIGYVDCFATHHFHGAKSRRGYSSRDAILVKHQFSPVTDLHRDWQGVYQLTPDKPAMRDDFRQYFISRSEDDPGLYEDAPAGGML